MTYAAIVHGQHLHWQDCLDYGLRAIELASRNQNPLSDVNRRWWTAASLLRTGHFEEARHQVEVLQDFAERRTTPRRAASSALEMIAYMWILVGNWEAGREISDHGLDLATLNPQLLMLRVSMEYETGHSAQ